MNIICVTCGAGVPYGLASLADQAVVVCAGCGTGLRLAIQPFAVPVPTAKPSAAATSSAERVIVAVDGEATREVIRDLLIEAGFEVVEAATGQDTLDQVRRRPPALIIVDVGLSDMMGFQVCEAIRREPANARVKIILVAAIYNKVRYRRQPGNLFGADDFIERHEIETELLGKARRLCGGDAPPVQAASPVAAVPPAPTQEGARPVAAPPVAAAPPPPRVSPPAPAPPVVPAAPPRAAAPVPVIDPLPASAPVATPEPAAPVDAQQEAARRLARIIVSDIALYNAKKVDEGVTQGTFFDLLRQEISEGRRLYEERLSPDLAGAGDLFQQTLDQFIATRKQLLDRQKQAAA